MMDKQENFKDGASKSRIALLVLVSLIAIFMFSSIASAAITDSFRNMGSSVGGYFNTYASDDNPQFLDFLIFSVIFIAMSWIGFSTAFKEAKNANVALAGSVGLALSVALVYGGKFTVKKLLPFAAILLFILCVIWIYSLLKKFVFTKDTLVSKILAVVFSLVISIALFALILNMICSGNNCENNAFMRKLFGSESIFGKIFTGTGSLFSGWGGALPTPSGGTGGGTGLSNASIGSCGNGVKDAGEACDIGKDKQSNIGCQSGYLCNNCSLCEKQSLAGGIIDNISNYWYVYLLLLAVLVLFIWKRKPVTENVKKHWKGWREKRKKKNELNALNKLLSKMKYDERQLSGDVKQLIDNVKQEKTPFEASRHIIDEITKDIKETIGQERELIKHGEDEGLFKQLKALHKWNEAEHRLVNTNILPTIRREVNTINEEMAANEKIMAQLNSLENVGSYFDEHKENIEDFKRFNFNEKGVIDNMLKDIKENEGKFVELSGTCEAMLSSIDDEERRMKGIIASGSVSYASIIEHIKAIRVSAIKLNNVFITKINTLRYIVAKMEEVKQDVHRLHAAEIENLNSFYAKAVESKNNQMFDRALYFAMHVIENARFLEHIELGAEATAKLKELEANGVTLVREILPFVFTSVKPKIEEELLKGKYDDVKRTLAHLKNVEFIFNNAAGSTLELAIQQHKAHVEKIELLCDKVAGLAEKRKAVEELFENWNTPVVNPP